MSGADDLEEQSRPAVAAETESGAPSRPSRTDCVAPESGGESATHAIPEDRAATPLDRVEEFREEYPHLAERRITERHGRSLRREATDAEYEAQYVEPEVEWENGHVTYRLKQRKAATWADVLFAFLDSHRRYEEGMQVRFVGTDETGEDAEFTIDLEDSWGESYAKREYARAMALERQLAGGEHPDGTELEGSWDNLVTVMLTLTGSSVPEGPLSRLAPVDQFDPVSDSWSYGGVRDAARNVCERDLGLESHEWEYLRFAEPHGVAASKGDDEPGANACYSHTHVGLYLDLDLDRLQGGEDRLRNLFYEKAIGKHLESCEIAGEKAHTPDSAVSVNTDVTNMGSYMSAYMCTFSAEEPDDEDGERPEFVPLVERPIEYVAWGAVMWSMNRQRIGRSKGLNEAITADQCMANYRDDDHVQAHDHGDRLSHRESGYGSTIICADCGSGWDLDPDAETIAELRREAEQSDDGDHADQRASRSGHHADCGECDHDLDCRQLEAALGESTEWARISQPLINADVRDEVEDFLAIHGDDFTVPELVGKLSIHPKNVPAVEAALNDESHDPVIESWRDESEPELPNWEVDVFIDPDGNEHLVSADGGVEMCQTYLPMQHLLKETRLRHHGEVMSPKIRCRRCNVATYSPETMVSHLVHKHEIEQPEFADYLLKFEVYSGDLPEVFHEPESSPSPGV